MDMVQISMSKPLVIFSNKGSQLPVGKRVTEMLHLLQPFRSLPATYDFGNFPAPEAVVIPAGEWFIGKKYLAHILDRGHHHAHVKPLRVVSGMDRAVALNHTLAALDYFGLDANYSKDFVRTIMRLYMVIISHCYPSKTPEGRLAKGHFFNGKEMTQGEFHSAMHQFTVRHANVI